MDGHLSSDPPPLQLFLPIYNLLLANICGYICWEMNTHKCPSLLLEYFCTLLLDLKQNISSIYMIPALKSASKYKINIYTARYLALNSIISAHW